MNNQLIIENLKNIINTCPIEKIQISNSEITIVVKPMLILDILLFFKNHILHQFKVLTCISGVDYSTNKFCFKIVYELLSIRYNSRIKD